MCGDCSKHERAGDEATGVRRVGDLELTYKGAKPDWSGRRELTRRWKASQRVPDL